MKKWNEIYLQKCIREVFFLIIVRKGYEEALLLNVFSTTIDLSVSVQQ